MWTCLQSTLSEARKHVCKVVVKPSVRTVEEVVAVVEEKEYTQQHNFMVDWVDDAWSFRAFYLGHQ